MGGVVSKGSGSGVPSARPNGALTKSRGGKDAAALLGEVRETLRHSVLMLKPNL